MFCIEFDLTNFPVEIPQDFEMNHNEKEIESYKQEVENNRKFRVLN